MVEAVRLAVDLHLHSRFSSGVSLAMTLDNIAYWAKRKGLDLVATGDCLQPQWLAEIEDLTMETEPGWRQLKPAAEKAVHARLPASLRRPVRFVLSTEVNCAPAKTDAMHGLHQLLYFPSVEAAREFAAVVGRSGDLQEGRPTLATSANELLRLTASFDRVWMAPAHVMNPYFSALGVIGGATSLDKVYGEETPRLLAVETGLTSNPMMCRRVPSVDRFGLFSCSDAHSLENLGRECTLVDIQPGYDALMAALRAGSSDRVRGLLKFPIESTRYYLNWCGICKTPFDAHTCPRCGRALVTGSRDRLPRLEDVRAEPLWSEMAPPAESLSPLAWLIAGVEGRKADSAGVKKTEAALVDHLGQPERYILTEATSEELVRFTKPEIAAAILNQRTGAISRRGEPGLARLGQETFGF